jgi:hypothetical protein
MDRCLVEKNYREKTVENFCLRCNFIYNFKKLIWFPCDSYRNDVKGSISETLDEDEEILGSDDDEQEDPRDYTKGTLENMIDQHH